jgi:hypothetical protein
MTDKKQSHPQSSQPQNEGEGSRSAARRYDSGAEKMAHSGKVDTLAQKAKDALGGKEAEELKRAEAAGKKGKHR